MPTSIRVEEKYATRKGNRDREGYSTYSRNFTVTADSVLNEKEALDAVDTTTAAAVPKPQEKHPGDPRAVVVGVSASTEDTNKIWQIEVNYEVIKGEGPHDTEDETEDPCDKRPVVRFGSAPYQKIVTKAYQVGDEYGIPTQPIQNSAGDPFDPPIQEEINRPVIHCEYNVRKFSPALKLMLEGSINQEAVTVAGIRIPARKARISLLEANPLYDDYDNLYWQMTIELELNGEGFNHRILDQGFYYLTGSPAVKKEITAKDKDGADVAVTEPQKLNGTGGIGTTPVYLEFQTKWPLIWKSLNLPRSY